MARAGGFDRKSFRRREVFRISQKYFDLSKRGWGTGSTHPSDSILSLESGACSLIGAEEFGEISANQ